jgi:hypothetical protein
MPLPIQKSSSTTTLVSSKSKNGGPAAPSSFGPVDMHYMRRLAVRMQKQSVIQQKLNELKLEQFIVPATSYFICLVSVFVVQIVIVVEQTSLFYVCSGFWVSVIYAICIVTIVLLGKSFFKRWWTFNVFLTLNR